jgi:hypothetical protein
VVDVTGQLGWLQLSVGVGVGLRRWTVRVRSRQWAVGK